MYSNELNGQGKLWEHDMAAVSVTIKQIGVSASDACAREHHLTMDRPQAKGGTNAGMMGGEALLSGLGGCFMSNLLAAATARELTLSAVQLLVTGQLAEEGPSRFVSISLEVSTGCPAPEDFAKLVAIAERGCIVANTLRNAVELLVKVKP